MALSNVELARKIDELPDKLIKRLDDRYYKKEEVDDKLTLYVSKGTFTIVASTISFFMFILGAIGGFIIQLWTTLNGVIK